MKSAYLSMHPAISKSCENSWTIENPIIYDPRYVPALENPDKISCWRYLDSKTYRNKFAHNGAGSISIGIPIFCLNAMLSTEN